MNRVWCSCGVTVSARGWAGHNKAHVRHGDGHHEISRAAYLQAFPDRDANGVRRAVKP